MSPAPPRNHHRALYLFLLVVAVSLWRILHRQDPTEWSAIAEPAGDQALAEPADDQAPTEVREDPLADLARTLGDRQNGHAGSPEPLGHRYAVKWTDRSQDAHARRERRDLTFDQAGKDAGWMVRHTQHFYAGAWASRSPFSELRVYLQCLCGRDITDLTAPHTVPGQDRVCPSSASGMAPQSEALSSVLTALH